MKKIAFFVEGYTEQSFIVKLFKSVCANDTVAIETGRIKGGSNVSISFSVITAIGVTTKTKYYVLVVNCGGDKNVKSYILERRKNLIAQGYIKIIGIRDVFPDFSKAEIPKLEDGLYRRMPQAQLRTDFILGIMEVEAWFLSEHTHFSKIHPDLNPQLIKSQLKFDPEHEDMEMRDHPAKDLNDAYNLVGENYSKGLDHIKRTVDSIDCAEIYFNPKLNSVKKLVAELNDFIST